MQYIGDTMQHWTFNFLQKDLIKAVKGFRDACDAEHADACLGAGMACQEKVDSYHDIAAKNLMMMGCNYCDFYKTVNTSLLND